MKSSQLLSLCALFLLVSVAFAAPPRDAVPLDAPEPPLNFRLHLEFSAAGTGVVRLSENIAVPLVSGLEHDLAVEHPPQSAPLLRVWGDGKLVRGPEEVPWLSASGA